MVVIVSAIISIIFRYIITFVSAGFAVIISAITASAIGALLFPVKEEN